MSKPVIYLDVDDTLLAFPRDKDAAWWSAHREGVAADGAGDFLRWAVEHCEVRWLTSWCPSGQLDPEIGVPRLARLLGVDGDMLAAIRNPRGWINSKVEGIDWLEHIEGREWAWIEDELPEREKEGLRERRAFDRYYYVNSGKDAAAFRIVWWKVARRFGLPVPDGAIDPRSYAPRRAGDSLVTTTPTDTKEED